MATLKSNWRGWTGALVGFPRRSKVVLLIIVHMVGIVEPATCLLPSLRVRIFSCGAPGLFLPFLKPRRNASRWDRASRQLRNDCSGGHDQSFVEFDTRKVLGLRFGLKRLGQPRTPASNGCASPRDFEGHIPSMLLHPMIPMGPPPSITFSASVMRLARRRTWDVGRVRFLSPSDV